MEKPGKPHKIRQVQLVGRKIRRLRKERRLTQTELSARIGVQQSDLSRMEKGEYRVSLDTLFKILSEFEISIGEFFEDDQEPLGTRELRLARQFTALDPQAQLDVEELIALRARSQERSEGESR